MTEKINAKSTNKISQYMNDKFAAQLDNVRDLIKKELQVTNSPITGLQEVKDLINQEK